MRATQGIEEVKTHPWFEGVSWEAVLTKQYRAPFVPLLKSLEDVSYFDSEFTEAPIETYTESLSYSKPNMAFRKRVVTQRDLRTTRQSRRKWRRSPRADERSTDTL